MGLANGGNEFLSGFGSTLGGGPSSIFVSPAHAVADARFRPHGPPPPAVARRRRARRGSGDEPIAWPR
jgi:hypothetical protein